MKKKIIYTLLGLLAITALPACHEDYEDASKPHSYGPDENPFVKANPATMATEVFGMVAGQEEPAVIDIYDYDDMIQSALGISAQELISKLGTDYTCCPINPNRMVWVQSKKPNTGDKYGWYVNKSGNVCDPDADNIYGKLIFDVDSHCFKFYIDPKGGGVTTLQIGFAKLGGDNFNTHVRFGMQINAFDQSFVFRDLVIPAGDYNAEIIDFSDIADNIDYVFGMTPEQFANAVGNGLTLYMIDHNTLAPMWDAPTTANSGGYWCDADGNVQNWGDGCAYYLEPWIGDGEMCFAIGRYPGWNAGTMWDVKFAVVSDANKDKVLSFYINTVLE